MDEIHMFVPIPKTPSLRSRPTSSDASLTNLTRSERGLAQRSLLYCLEKGYFCLIRYLLESGVGDARERDHDGRTALIYCCFIEDDCWAQNIAMTLLEKGAQIADHDHRGLNALHYAIITQRTILIRLYLDSIDCDFNQSTDIYGNTCLHYAASTGNLSIVRAVLHAMKRYSVDLAMKNHSGLTAYDVAYQLNFERCQNLLRNEMTLQERANLSKTPTKPTVPHRRLSISDRIRSLTSSSNGDDSVVSLPYYVSSSSSIRKGRESTSILRNEHRHNSPAKLIDPTETRVMTFKRNKHLDASLLKHVKNRADFAPSIFASSSEVFHSSSTFTSASDVFNSPSTASWREDVPKMFDQLQILRSRSYRNSVHPPLNKELPQDLFERLYDLNDNNSTDRSRSRTLSSQPADLLQKMMRKPRMSMASIKPLSKIKK